MGLGKSAVEIRPATWADRDEIAGVLARGFAEEELHNHMFPGKYEYLEDYIRSWRHVFEERWLDYSRIWFVAVALNCNPAERRDSDQRRSRIVGVSEWRRTGPGWERVWGSFGPWDPRNMAQYVIKSLHQGQNWWAPNRAVRQPSEEDPRPLTKPTFSSRIVPFMVDLFPYETYWELCTLAVDSSERHRGVGSALVKSGLSRATEEKIPVSVVAAKDTEKFYKSCGFKNCLGVASEIQVEGLINPLTVRGLGGGAVLWTDPPVRKEAR